MAKTVIPIELSSTPGIVDNSNATAITIDSSEDVTLAGHIILTDSKIVKLGTGADLQLYHDGSHSYINNSTGNLAFDVAGDFSIDADGGDIVFNDGGSEIGRFTNSSSDFVIKTATQDKDLIFKGNDGGSVITALTLDMSDAGTASFNHDVKLGDDSILSVGDGTDLQLYHDGTDSIIKNTVGHLYITTSSDDKDIIFQCDDGSGGLTQYIRVDGSVSLTQFDKDTKHVDSVKATFGDAGDLQIYHDGTHNYIDVTTSDQDLIIKGTDGGSDITALTLDMSNAGHAVFGHTVAAKGYITNGNSGVQGFQLGIDGATDSLSGRLFFTETDSSWAIFNSNESLSFNYGGTYGSSSGTQKAYLTSAGALVLDAGATFGDSVNISHGTPVLTLTDTSSSATTTITLDGVNTTIDSNGTDGDIIFKGNDGGSEITALTLDMSAAGAATFNGAVTIGGDLTVSGTTTTLNTATLDVEDKNITLNKGSGDTSGSANGAGITIQDAVDASNDATLLWDASNDEFDFSHKVTAPALTVDELTIDADTITATDDFIIDATTNIFLDADGGEVVLRDGGTNFGYFHQDSDNFEILSTRSDGDIIIKGNDGGSTITALTLDMSDAGKATFNAGVVSANNSDTQSIFGRTALGFVSGLSDYAYIGHLDVADSGGYALVQSSAGATFLNAEDGQDIRFLNHGSTSMTLDDSGKLGIGTTSPARALHVKSSDTNLGMFEGSNGEGIAIVNNTDGRADIIGYSDTASAYNALHIRAHSGSGLHLDTSGNVGIGTTSPNESGFQSGSRVLTIQGAAADDFGVIELLSTDTTSSNRIGEIRFGNMDATNAPVGMAGIRARRNGADNTADLSMWTTNAGTFAERLTVGHTGPVVTITDDGTDGYETLLKLYRSSASANEVGLQFDLAGSGGAGQAVAIYASKGEDWSSGTSRSATLNFQCKDDGTDQIMYQFGNFSDGVNQHKFYTEGAERMRLDQNGVLLVGTTSALSNAKLTVDGGDMMVQGANNSCGISDLLPGYTRGDYGVVYSTANHVYFAVGSSYVSYINGGNGTFNVSDQRLKENVATLTGTLDKVKQLRGVSFTWKDTEERGTDTAIGLIAQEVETIYPELVDDGGLPKDNEGNDPYKSVNYAHLTSVLIEAIKELSTELDAAKARITTLEG